MNKNFLEEKKIINLDYKKELKIIKNSKEFIYIINLESNMNDLKKIHIDYINKIKNGLLDKHQLKEYYYELIPDDIKIDFTYGYTNFPLLIIKEKHKNLFVVEGIKNI